MRYRTNILLCTTLKKKWLTEPPKKVLEKSKSIQMRPKPQKRMKNLAEPFEGSEFHPTAEPSLVEPFLSFAEQKRFRRKNRKP